MKSLKETFKWLSLKETIKWRIIAVCITFTITYLWTGSIRDATPLTITLESAKTIGFYLWRKIENRRIRIKIENEIKNNKNQL